ncbi:MAG: Bifunctional oligoribonuclease and PAP phosphatase NrnA [bacterium ADurb.Bin212]|nr:MAG: Bifunctional oligoribonuclease and PAP phosphatase NrnA [bacterium ADurb.Bin212]
MKQYNELNKVLEGKTGFLLITHEEPDGDAIGATLSLYSFLSDSGKKVLAVSRDSVPPFFSFLDENKLLNSDFLVGDYEVIILIDNGDLKRTGFADRIKKAKRSGKTIINIDHHPQNDIWKLADINIAFPSYSSTSEIMYEILTVNGYEIDSTVATALLAGIYYDTGGFQHSNTSKKVMDIVSDLLKRGARLKKISKNIAKARSVNMLKLWGIALNRITIVKEFGLAYSVLTQDDIRYTGASEEEISGLVNLINSAAEAEASLLIYESDNGNIKGSLRTESDKVDVSALAKLFGGGGHKKASGFSFSGRITKVGENWRLD